MKQHSYPDDDAFINRLRQNMQDPRAQKVPEALLPENLDALLQKAAQPQQPERTVRFPLRRTVAMAAALVIVIAAAVLIPRSDKSSTLDLANFTAMADSGKAVSADYSQIQQVLMDIREKQLAEWKKSTEGVLYETTDTALPETNQLLSMPANAVGGMGGMENGELESGNTDIAADNFSATNVQVADVDEADIIKTDGDYLYCVTNRNTAAPGQDDTGAQVQIVSTDADGSMSVVWTHLSDRYRIDEIFLYDQKLILMGSPLLSYGSDASTVTEIYDVADPTAPKLMRTFSQEGLYDTSRVIDGRLLLVSVQFVNLFSDSEDTSFSVESVLPKTCDSTVSAQPDLLPADRIYWMPNVRDAAFTTVSLIDLNAQEPAQSISVLGEGTLYANTQNIYLACTAYDNSNTGNLRWYSGNADTDIARIDISGSQPVFVATGHVKGTLCSQFAMDEYDGYLRVATNSSQYHQTKGYSQENNFYVLDLSMNTVGILEGLAPNENMYAVRFEGETAYAVTYRTTDPFFVIDLTDPTRPTVTGELKIPGFSQYLHPYDGTRVIGFGIDTLESPDGSAAYTQGFKIAMFNVSDPENPIEEDVIYIGDRGSYSEILSDHKALLFSRDKNLIGIPITITKTESASPLDYGQTVFEGYILLGYSDEKGFYELGRVAHRDESTGLTENVLRGAYIGNVLYTLSDCMLVSTDLTTMQPLDQLFFPENPGEASSDPYFMASSAVKIY